MADSYSQEIPLEKNSSSAFIIEDQIGFRLRRAYQKSMEVFASRMAGLDITAIQFAALAKLNEVGPVPQNQLAKLTAMDPATTLGVVNRMKAKGLMRKTAHERDARVTLVSLTEEGRIMVARMVSLANNLSEEIMAPLTDPEAKTLMNLLNKIG